MKFQIAFGLMILIVALIAIFIGAPYLFNVLKSNQFLPSLGYSASSTLGYYIGSRPLTYPSVPSAAPGGQQAAAAGESVYKGRVGMSVYRYGQKQISLGASYFSGAPINITGWKIKSANRGETIIGRGAAIPQFDELSDIRLSGGESAEIIVGPSPLVKNFRVNACFGWLSNLYNISYSLSYCPRLELGDLGGLDSACKDLILRSNSCQAPSDNILNSYSAQCRNWVGQNMNYGACVAKNRNDSGFFKEWRIYTGNLNQIFDPLHDVVELRDQAGLLVDKSEY